MIVEWSHDWRWHEHAVHFCSFFVAWERLNVALGFSQRTLRHKCSIRNVVTPINTVSPFAAGRGNKIIRETSIPWQLLKCHWYDVRSGSLFLLEQDLNVLTCPGWRTKIQYSNSTVAVLLCQRCRFNIDTYRGEVLLRSDSVTSTVRNSRMWKTFVGFESYRSHLFVFSSFKHVLVGQAYCY